jgi:hypothetical protein
MSMTRWTIALIVGAVVCAGNKRNEFGNLGLPRHHARATTTKRVWLLGVSSTFSMSTSKR